jgi:rhamnosyltransferase
MAIHIHIVSINTFFNCINILKNTQYQYDLFVSTDSENKAKKIKNILIENDIYNKIKMQDIIVYPRFKGDIYPLISSFEFLKDKYTIIGYIHINKVYGFFKRIWLRRMLKRILNIDNILQVFSQNENIGIIITDIYNLIKNKSNLSWGKNKDIYVELWEYMKCKKEFCINKYDMPIIPSELMFWYKKEALQPLYELNLETSEVLLEKFHFKKEKSIFEAIEKLLVYIAWDNNYDYRVIVDKNTDISKIERRIMFLKLLLNRHTKIIKWWKIFNDKGFLFTLNLIVYELNKKFLKKIPKKLY